MSGDYISREAAIVRATKGLADDFDAYNVKVNLEAIPAADVVEVRHGRWMVAGVNLHFNSVCSACGENFYSPLRGAYIVHHAKYCPNCGAKMDGGQDDD